MLVELAASVETPLSASERQLGQTLVELEQAGTTSFTPAMFGPRKEVGVRSCVNKRA